MISPSSTMENGRFREFTGYRSNSVKNIAENLGFMLVLMRSCGVTWLSEKSDLLLIGTGDRCSLCSQSGHAIPWLDIVFHPRILQVAFEFE